MKTIFQKIKNDKRFTMIILILGVIVGISIGMIISPSHSHTEATVHEHGNASPDEPEVWTCSMHPQIKQNKPGLCPICAMDLVPMESGNNEGEHVDPNEIQMTESALALASVQTSIVKRGIPEKDIQLLGRVKADERNIAEITARFGGRIEKLEVNYTGQQVRKGQKLGTIYSPELITAQKELLEAVKYKDVNPSFYKTARTKLKLWDLSETQIDAIVNNGEPKLYFDIVSPISGTVTMRHIALGDYIKEGSALFEVIDLKSVWIMFDAYESDLPWIEKGDQMEFSIQSLPGKYYAGTVAYIDPFIDAQTRVAQVRVELDNPDLKLKPEMFANGILMSNSDESSNELLIPKSAILWTGKRSVVYIRVPERETASFIYREVVLGPDAGNFYVVSEGLKEGEEIATNGVFKIDAAAQLAGKSSMMNPQGGKVSTGHDHGNMTSHSVGDHSEQVINLEELHHEKFTVSGNCEMCKTTIESTAKAQLGIGQATWDIETKELHIYYDHEVGDLADIHKAIADAGYDTELETAPKSAYNNLPACCQYTRANESVHKANVVHESFKVSGNCGMCKETIEKAALSLNGVNEAEWDQDAKLIHVSFNDEKVSLQEIHKAIAMVGYDTELEKADDDVYSNLHGCCKYTRE